MTDGAIAGIVRAAADDMRNPLSVGCSSCGSTGGDACIPAEPENAGPAHHRSRVIDARMTAEGVVLRLLTELADAT